MDWITIEEVKHAARSLKTAIACSIKHHEQLRGATMSELLKGIQNKETSILSTHCTLCQYKKHQNESYRCPLLGTNRHCISCIWQEIQDTLELLLFTTREKGSELLYPASVAHRTFRKAEGRMIAELKSLNKKYTNVLDEIQCYMCPDCGYNGQVTFDLIEVQHKEEQ